MLSYPLQPHMQSLPRKDIVSKQGIPYVFAHSHTTSLASERGRTPIYACHGPCYIFSYRCCIFRSRPQVPSVSH